jgi:transposase
MKNCLWLPGWLTEEPVFDENKATVVAEYNVLPEHCPKCGCVGRLYRHGSEPVEYKDAPAFGKQLVVVVEVKRFRCRECGKTFMQALPDMHPTRQLTNRCVQHLLEQCVRRNYAEMSRETGVDESVIRAICNQRHALVPDAIHPEAPEVLGIDELTLDGKLRFIAIDVMTKKILDIREDCDTKTVEKWLFLMRDKDRVRIVTTDMRKQYHEIVKRVLPQAIIVADRWHIQSKANGALDRVRARHKRNEATKEKRRIADELARTGKKPKSRREKDPWRLRRVLQQSRHKHKPMTVLLLDGVLKNNPLLSDAWHAKESFYDIWDAKSSDEARGLFAKWRKRIPKSVKKEFGAVATTVDNFQESIFAYFDHRYTNALTEAINGLIKIVNRGGRGYVYKNIRAKALGITPIGDRRKAKREAKQASKKVVEACRFVCEFCGAHYDQPAETLSVTHVRPLAIGAPTNMMTLCATCNRFHVERWFSHDDDSTLKNG